MLELNYQIQRGKTFYKFQYISVESFTFPDLTNTHNTHSVRKVHLRAVFNMYKGQGHDNFGCFWYIVVIFIFWMPYVLSKLLTWLISNIFSTWKYVFRVFNSLDYRDYDGFLGMKVLIVCSHQTLSSNKSYLKLFFGIAKNVNTS